MGQVDPDQGQGLHDAARLGVPHNTLNVGQDLLNGGAGPGKPVVQSPPIARSRPANVPKNCSCIPGASPTRGTSPRNIAVAVADTGEPMFGRTRFAIATAPADAPCLNVMRSHILARASTLHTCTTNVGSRG